MWELSPLFGTKQSWGHINIVHRPVTHMTRSEGVKHFITISPSKTHMLPAILDFAKGAFFEVNRGKNHTVSLFARIIDLCERDYRSCFLFCF